MNLFVPGKFMVDALTVENYIKFFTDIYYYSVLTRTVRIALVTTLICLVLGFPLAYVLARTRTRHKNLLIMLVVLPLFVGNAVRAAGWMVAFGNKGLINASLTGLGALSPPFGASIAFILMTATLLLTLAANLLVQQRYRTTEAR